MPLICNRIFTLQIMAKQFSRPQTQTLDVFIDEMDRSGRWRDEQKNARTRARKQEGMDGRGTRINLLNVEKKKDHSSHIPAIIFLSQRKFGRRKRTVPRLSARGTKIKKSV